jgi:ferredoxin
MSKHRSFWRRWVGNGQRERTRNRRDVTAAGWVIPEPSRCVQCGICSFYCPIEIDVRRHAWLAEPVKDSHCLTCGECVARCPRGVLRFEQLALFGGED